MDTSTVIGVLLRVYNGDKLEYLRLAIDSIFKQTYSNYILLIGVDGIITKEVHDYLNHLDSFENVNVSFFKSNRGLACVLNDLISVAKKLGITYYARMDADDVAEEKRFEYQIKFLQNNLEIDVVGGAIEEIDEYTQLRNKRIMYPLSHHDCFRFFRYRDPLAHPAVMFRSTYFDKVCGYRDKYRKNQDTMLWLDGFLNGCHFANIPNTVLYFRITEDFFLKRRNGLKRAWSMLKDRFMINKKLHYGFFSYVFAIVMFIITITPAKIKAMIYKLR